MGSLSTVSQKRHYAHCRREKKAEGSDGDSDGDGGVKLSVFERISKMENKLEEEKFGSARSRSGFTTPKSAQKTW